MGETGPKRVAEFTTTFVAIVVAVIVTLFAGGYGPFDTRVTLWILIVAAAAMTVAFGGGFEWAGRRWETRRRATLIRKYPDLVAQLSYVVNEIVDATSSSQARINQYGYIAFRVQQDMAGAAAGSESQKVSEKAAEILNAWQTGEALREATKRTVQARCDSDARRLTAAFGQALEETQGLAISAMGSVSSYLYCIRRGFPCDKVGSEEFDNWASFAGRVNQYQDQLSYLIRTANELFGFEVSPYFRPVPPWLWLRQ